MHDCTLALHPFTHTRLVTPASPISSCPVSAAAATSVSASVIDTLVNHWRTEYDWRAHESLLNERLFSVSIDGLRVVFHHFYSRGSAQGSEAPPTPGGAPSAKPPVLLLHGWPGSIVEFKQFSRLLVRNGHDVVAPCLPGYGWSAAPHAPGFGLTEMAVTMLKLMDSLGYDKRYLIQAGDWGALISQRMTQIDPTAMAGLHVNFSPIPIPDSLLTVGQLLYEGDAVEVQRFKDTFDMAKVLDSTGYLHVQATTPDILGLALAESPVGMLAWIADKFQKWSDPKQVLTSKFARDDIITNVMVYWASNSFTSAARLYREAVMSNAMFDVLLRPITVPSGVALFPHELFPPPAAFVKEKYKLLVHLETMQQGGHFAALEVPVLLYQHFAKFCRRLGPLGVQTEPGGAGAAAGDDDMDDTDRKPPPKAPHEADADDLAPGVLKSASSHADSGPGAPASAQEEGAGSTARNTQSMSERERARLLKRHERQRKHKEIKDRKERTEL